MDVESGRNMPSGLVRALASRWEVNDRDADVQRPTAASVPHMHNKFLQDVLSRMDGTFEVAGFTAEKVSEGGPYQTSIVTRVTVLNTDHSSVTLLFKTVNSASPKAKALKFKEMFKKEAFMYSTAIPAMMALLPDDSLNIFATSYHCSADVVVLEDIRCHEGDHTEGLNAGHCRLVLAALGRLHAAAHALPGDVRDEVGKEVQRTAEAWDRLAEHAAAAVQVVRTSPRASRYIRKVEAFLSDAKRQLQTFQTPGEEFWTLNHGELWAGNLTFCYQGNEPTAVKLLNFQACHYGSPVLDIIHLLYTSTRSEVRVAHMDDFARTYHRALTRTLRQLGVGGAPSLVDLRREIDSKERYGLLAAVAISDAADEDESSFARRIEDVVLDLGNQGVF
ncbi:uncharacterized protein [Periplaneta americana]|uniref:uncharacterized protein n=1 Tax=Periplaneta americana TaxID=6978 RepID=UPI0037E872BD